MNWHIDAKVGQRWLNDPKGSYRFVAEILKINPPKWICIQHFEKNGYSGWKLGKVQDFSLNLSYMKLLSNQNSLNL